MKNPKAVFTLSVLFATAVGLLSSAYGQEEVSFRAQYQKLAPTEQKRVKNEASQKEDYSQFPKIRELNSNSVVTFCKLLPRGLETFFPEKVAGQQTAVERKRTELWAQYLSCQDSLLYYEGHRFFKSGHYSDSEILGSVTEIKKVMKWLVEQEAKL